MEINKDYFKSFLTIEFIVSFYFGIDILSILGNQNFALVFTSLIYDTLLKYALITVAMFLWTIILMYDHPILNKYPAVRHLGNILIVGAVLVLLLIVEQLFYMTYYYDLFLCALLSTVLGAFFYIIWVAIFFIFVTYRPPEKESEKGKSN